MLFTVHVKFARLNYVNISNNYCIISKYSMIILINASNLTNVDNSNSNQ